MEMWSGNWQQWPLQQANYQNVPHDQVDWAALAKQWIQLQHSGGGEGPPQPPHRGPPAGPRPPPGSQPASAPHHSHGGLGLEPPGAPGVAPPPPLPPLPTPLAPAPSARNPPSRGTSGEGPNSDPGFWGWDAGNDWKETYDYGHVHGNQPPLQAHSYDYNHGSDQYAYNQQGYCPEPTPYGPPYWAPGLPPPPGSGHLPPAGHNLTPSGPGPLEGAAAMPPFLRKEKKLLSAGAEHLLLVDDLSAQMGLDAAKRKSLPAWIREGLEKMERDKLRQQERERLREEYQTRKAAKAGSAAVQEGANQAGKTPDEVDAALLAKSKFDSDSEEEPGERAEGETSEEMNGQKGEGGLNRTVAPVPLGPEASQSATPIDFLSEEEKREAMMLKVRRMLTEILLEVTNQEILSLCKEVHMRIASKAPARQLASSTALSSIAGALGGLSGYGSGANHSGGSEADSSSSEGEDEEEDSDLELEKQIREKRQNFLEREREIEAMLDAEAQKEKLRHVQESSAKEEPSSGEPPPLLPETEESQVQPSPNGSSNSQVKTEKEESDQKESPKRNSQGSNSGSFSDASSLSNSSSFSARSPSRKKYKKSDVGKRSQKAGKRGTGGNDKRHEDRKTRKSRSRSRDKSTRYRSRSRERRRDRSSSERWRHRSRERTKGSRSKDSQKGFHSRNAAGQHRSKSRDRYPQSSTDKRKKSLRSPSPLAVKPKKKKPDHRRSRSDSPKRSRKKKRSSSSESERSGKKSSGKRKHK